MNPLKRLTLSISAQFNELVMRVENHEAVAEAVLAEFRDNIHQATYRLKILEKEISRTREKIAALKVEHETWGQRAVKSQSDDREKALECVRRMKIRATELQALETQLKEMISTQAEVQRDLRSVETQYQELKCKHKILASRQTRAEVFKGLRACTTDGNAPTADIFERWESSVMRAEVCGIPPGTPTDSLDDEFRSKEQEAELEEALNELTRKNE
ncbi:MAG: PspA/IM30 family protein [Bdellovibrionales bacterium]